MSIVLLILLIVAGCAVLLRPRTTVADVDRLIRAKISLGSSHERVGDVLDSLGVEHSGYADREMYAVWRRTQVGIFSDKYIQAKFLFDTEGRLARYELHESIMAL